MLIVRSRVLFPFRTPVVRRALSRLLPLAFTGLLLLVSPVRAEVPAGWVGASAPSGREEASMVWDSGRNRIVLFGGATLVGWYNGDTWEWDGSHWTKSTAAAAPTRRNACIAWDGAHNMAVLFGGFTTRTGFTYLSDTWTWNGTKWADVSPPSPGWIYMAQMVFDTARQQTLVCTGLNSADAYLDLWARDGTDWTHPSTEGPPTRRLYALAFDSHRGKAVLFGGENTQGRWFGDTWEWDGSMWTRVSPSMGPSARSLAVTAYDSLRHRTILYGGASPTTGVMGDTWRWDGAIWKQVGTAGPPARQMSWMVYDSVRDRMVLHGGFNHPVTYVDTWEFDGSSWTQASSTGPPARGGATMAFDASRGRTVLFGGAIIGPDSSTETDEVWEWDGLNWALQSVRGPIKRVNADSAYDSARGRIVMFGGENSSYQFGDVWEYYRPPAFTISDAITALRLTAGVQRATQEEGTALDIVSSGPSARRVDIADAICVTRKAAGLESNP